MKYKFATLALATSLGTIGTGFGQGLLTLASSDADFEGPSQLGFTVNVDAGWDSNAGTTSTNETDSAFIRAGIGTQYSGGNRTTRYRLGGSFSTIYYLDQAPGLDDTLYNGRLSFGITHRVNRRLTISDNFYVAYEAEPDYQIGASAATRVGEYLYGYNSLSVSYAWTRRFSTVSGYSLSGIVYDDSGIGNGENRVNHLFSQQFRYLLRRTTSLVAEYRFGYVDYDDRGNDTSHYFLAGVDHSFSRTFKGSFRAGVEMRDRANGGQITRPYAEGSLIYQVAKHTSISWLNRVGLENSETDGFQSRYSYRSSLSARHQFTPRLSVQAGLSYVYSDFDGTSENPGFDENQLAVSLGASYQLYRNVSMNAGYYYTIVDSGNPFRGYDRHRISLGLSASF